MAYKLTQKGSEVQQLLNDIPNKQVKLEDSSSTTIDGDKVNVNPITTAMIDNFCSNILN